MQYLIDAFNAIIKGLGAIITVVLNLLPDSPFNSVFNIDSGWLSAMCWLFPIPSAIAHLEAFVSAVVVYYGLRIILRWIKAAGS